MGKKQNSVAAASKAKKDFKQRLATANVSNKISKANSKFKSTKPVVKNLKKIVNETRGKVTSTNVDFDNLQTQIYSAKKVQARWKRRETRSRSCGKDETTFPTRTWKRLWPSLTTFTRWLQRRSEGRFECSTPHDCSP